MENIKLYQKILMDHYKMPRNYGELNNPQFFLEKNNSNCGDYIKLEVNFDHSLITDVRFSGAGCAICIASASLMTDAIQNKSINYIGSLIKTVELVLDQKDLDVSFEYNDLIVMKSISAFPPRINCAKLPWKILKEIIMNKREMVY